MDSVSIGVLGAGSWGTALALLLARNGHRVRLWGHRPAHLAQIAKARCNDRYLPGVPFPAGLRVCPELSECVGASDLLLVVVPSHSYRVTLSQASPYLVAGAGVVWATKGLEHGSGQFLHQVTAEVIGEDHPTAIVSGPSFAREVAADLPTAMTVASYIPSFAETVADLLHARSMRAYTSRDVVGVELGGAVKNALAIAAGISDGLGFGANARAALVTRGLAEMVRLGSAVGGRRETFMGLAGLGDLVLTCTDDQSRNRRFGLALGAGQDLDTARSAIGQVVEGAATAHEIMRLANQHGVDMPITEQVDRVVRGIRTPREAVETLLAREPKPEL